MISSALVAIGLIAVLAGAAARGRASYRAAARQAETAFSRIAASGGAPLEPFDPQQVAHLPEVAQRYFHHAIAPGTPLYSAAELEMRGTFLLGDRAKFQTYRMSARQALKPPDQFVWIAEMHSGSLTITGSDALVGGEAWTRFWLLQLVPVAQARTSADLVRSAQFRAAVEGALWLPTSLLPGNGTQWEQTGPDTAHVTLRAGEAAITFSIVVDEQGAVKEVVGERWSNANPEKVFRRQPFGGTVLAERSFHGLTIPSRVSVGNHYGTDSYLPFFQAELTRVTFR